MDGQLFNTRPGVNCSAGSYVWAARFHNPNTSIGHAVSMRPTYGMLACGPNEISHKAAMSETSSPVPTHFIPVSKSRPDRLAWSNAVKAGLCMFARTEAEATLMYNMAVNGCVMWHTDHARGLARYKLPMPEGFTDGIGPVLAHGVFHDTENIKNAVPLSQFLRDKAADVTALEAPACGRYRVAIEGHVVINTEIMTDTLEGVPCITVTLPDGRKIRWKTHAAVDMFQYLGIPAGVIWMADTDITWPCFAHIATELQTRAAAKI